MKRRIETILIKASSDEMLPLLIEHPDMRRMVMEELVKAVEEGCNKQKSSTTLFHVYGSEYVIELDKYQWEKSLNSALEYYESFEDYEKCAKIKNLICNIP